MKTASQLLWFVLAPFIFSAVQCLAQSPTLAEAVNAPQLIWATGGNANWFRQTNLTHDGIAAGRSGAITNNRQTWIETTVTGPATLAFWWRVHSEAGYDYLSFSIDGVAQAGAISGFVGWVYKAYGIPVGSHVCRWSFTNDQIVTVGDNSAWLDQVQLLPPASFADPRFVWPESPAPSAPYTNWQTAAHTIQDAVDVAAVGDTIWVTNGVYATGGRAVFGTMTNRVAVDRPVIVRSVNGPERTVIQGYQLPGMQNGDAAIRCVYLISGAVLDGFTLTYGATRASGDWFSEQSGGGVWSESTNAFVKNCIIVGNYAEALGGGAYDGTLNNCTLINNSALAEGGGAAHATMNGCAIGGNVAHIIGGGVYESTLNNCTVTGNSVTWEFGTGGGAESSTLNNCILYYNTATFDANYDSFISVLNYCCTTPAPSEGTGNITAEPQLASAFHLSTDSPCRAAGSATFAVGADIDGEPWLAQPSIGCDEYNAGAVTGALAVAISSSSTAVAVGLALDLTGLITGPATASVWDFGDGMILSNRPYASHAWMAAGTYRVVLRAFNQSYPEGVSETVTIRVETPIAYVSSSSSNPMPPYNSWDTAAQAIQDAVDAMTVPGAVVMVTNGVYANGSRAWFGLNRVVVDKPLILRSVNGPSVTIIQGYQVPVTRTGNGAIRCAYLANGAVLSGFTLTGGATTDDLSASERELSGGGVSCESIGAVVTNCSLIGNTAADIAGGSYLGTLNNCTITGNSSISVGGGVHDGVLNNCALAGNSSRDGGGAYRSTLNNCTLAGNTAARGGGVASANLNNCVVYFNSATNGPNYQNATLNYSCTTPMPTNGTGNIVSNPQFVNAVAGDYRLQPTSPCIDGGINQEWMFSAIDLAGNPRIINGQVDMGAYETPFLLNARAVLEGPYDPNTDTMAPGNPLVVPTTSPYASDPRQVSVIPANVVDWVLIELRDTNGNTVVAKSAFLDTQGQLFSVQGERGITVEISAGYYSVLVKHRNHLAVMSVRPVAFTNYLVNYDFTSAASQSLGGTNDVVQLEPGVWGMLGGDADGDGEVRPVDVLIYGTQTNRVGYRRADFDLDGIVSMDDLAMWTANQGRTTTVPNGETILTPALVVSPGRKTHLTGATQTFSVLNRPTATNWAMVKNPSGAFLSGLNTTSVVYQAGSVSNVVDIVEAWDEEDRLGRAYVNVISADEVARAGKAIVIAGLRSFDDPLWPVNDYLGDSAYNTLLYRGYSKQNIRYLNPLPTQDVDGNGQFDDISLATTLANVASTLTNWARNPDRLFIYLVDHGGTSSGAGYFRLNTSEILTATQLDAWLDALQTTYSNEVVVVIDCCESGSFLEPLRYPGPGWRTVMTACATNEPTYYLAGGLVSFSDAFFGGLLIGLDLENSFLLARGAMSPYQDSWMDANGDGRYASGTDPALVAGVFIGPSFVAGKDVPQIGHVLGNQSLSGTSHATLWAYDIVSKYPLERVWCVVVPPGDEPDSANPVADLPVLDLSYKAVSGRYEAVYGGFTEKGAYNILYYAQDIWGSVSAPRQGLVLQAGFDERLILVAGGTTQEAGWAATANMAATAYQTALARRLDKGAIHYLSADSQDVDRDGTNDVAGIASIANLRYAITNLATNVIKLTVYLVGSTTNGLFRLNGSESLSAGQLDGWLDSFQSSNAAVIVVMDFDGAGSYIPSLAAPPRAERIVIASTKAETLSVRAVRGLISFSQFFLSGLFNGESLGAAFDDARNAIKSASGRVGQTPQLDDNGNGIPDQKNVDGLLSAQRYLGAAFVTGEDAPFIGSVIPNLDVDPGWPVPLWVKDVWADAGISNVWCVITPPDYDGQGDLPQTNLVWNAGNGRYEVVYTSFTEPGTYVCTFLAQDNAGLLSSPMQCEVTTDAYEVDDTALQATIFTVGDNQRRNFHRATDEDWVTFYAPMGLVFNVDAKQLGTNSDLQVELYYEQPDGILQFIDWTDNHGRGSNLTESLTLDLKANPLGLSPGVYYVRVSSADINLFGLGSEYSLQIYVPIGGSGGVILLAGDGGGLFAIGRFYIALGPSQALIAGAGWRIVELTNPTYYSDTATYGLPIPDPGYRYTLAFRSIPGFRTPANRPLSLIDSGTTSVMANYVYTNLSPQVVSVSAGSNGIFKISYLGYAGKRYATEESTNLVNWMPLVTNEVPQNGFLRLATTNVLTKTHTFYRARLIQ